jgi:hypothetical protein
MEEERIFKEMPKLSELFLHRKASGDENGSIYNSQKNSGVQNESGRNMLTFGLTRLTNSIAEKFAYE